LQHAAENLSAIRGLAEIYHRRGELPEALRFYQSALSLAKHDPDLEQTIDEISRALTPVRPPIDDGMTFDEAQAEFLAALDGFEALGAAGDTEPELGAIGASGAMGASGAIGATGAMGAAAAVGARELPELERFLEAIHSYRQRHAV
jgi:tetratricopeptide (TPR) repeat protein